MSPSRRGEMLLLLAALFVFLAVAEGVVRLLGLERPRATGYAPIKTDRRAGRPLNSRGYRDNERSHAKPKDARRLVSLGDSFAWGASVEFEDAYPHRLERGLARRRGEPWEVVNLALPGLTTIDHAAQLAGEALAYEPDAVVLGYVLNDAESRQAMKEREQGYARRASRPPGLLEVSTLYRMLRGRLEATAESSRRIAYHRSLYDEAKPDWAAARKALRGMGALCRARGIPWVVAIFPLFGNPLDETYPFAEVHAKVAQAAGEGGAKVVDLLPVYHGLRWDVLVVDGYADEHPNEIAHRIAADTLLRALDDVIPWTGGKQLGKP